MTSMRERIARAMDTYDWFVIDKHIYPGAVDPDSRAIDMRNKSFARAVAVLAAMREPTEEMVVLGGNEAQTSIARHAQRRARMVWQAMIAAASCDSNSDRDGEKPSGFEGEASQSGAEGNRPNAVKS